MKQKIQILLCLMLLVWTGCTASVVPEVDGGKSIRPPLAPVEIDTSYSFICYDTNHLFIASDSTLINAFFNKLRKVTETGKGNINIVHIGSSHVQGGTLPHRIRTNILNLYPDMVGPRGMVFPYSVAPKCNNPYDYKVTKNRQLSVTRNVYKEPQHPMGLCGIAANASDVPAEIGIRLNEPSLDFMFDRVILLGESAEGVVPNIRCGTKTLIPSDHDSIHHRYLFNLPSATDSITIILPCDSAQTFSLRGVLLKNRKPGITYHSIGVNGASTLDYLKCQYFTNDLSMVKPDLVIFGIGINDASGPNFDTTAFRINYMRLIDSIRSVNPECAFIFITNNDSFKKVSRRNYTVNQNGLKARDVFYRLAEETHGCVWDQFAIMGGLKSMDKWRQAGLAQSDRVHFTRKGYEMIADLFSNALIEAFIQSPQVSNSNSKLTIKSKKKIESSDKFNERHPYISY